VVVDLVGTGDVAAVADRLGPMKPGGPMRSRISSSPAGRKDAPSAVASLISLTR